ncbi:MAG: DUF4392 domain-containing protein [Gammaproteobacteria bacterium]|nr:DUF4392 domain-containing protein [Gammaproteobacteria bacterium]
MLNDQQLSQLIEDALVARNPRGMAQVQPALAPGYCLRAAQILQACVHNKSAATVLIGTGFPVVGTFETDGPVGTIALYECLEALGAVPVIVCGQPLVGALAGRYRTHTLKVGHHQHVKADTMAALEEFKPQAIVSIERPGQAQDGGYYNMRGESISEGTACFDGFMKWAQCPTIAVGDGGNEIGMGNVTQALQELNIVPSLTTADELIVADVSNWGAYGMIAFLGLWHQQDLLAKIDPLAILKYLSNLGSVDGVTRINQLTEDGLPVSEGQSVIEELRRITGFSV